MHTKRLSDVHLFARLSKRDLETVSRLTDELDVEAGHVLMEEGDLGREFFVIESGRAEVTRDGARVAEMGPGDFFGEIALIEEERRTATVTAITPMVVVVLSGWDFRGLQQRLPAVHASVKDEIVKRRTADALSV